MEQQRTYTAFRGERRVAAGPLGRIREWVKDNGEEGLLIFEDETGKQVDFNFREAESAPGPGRPKLGVVAREVTLLPRHWEWLERQPSGASAALRRLVDQARNTPEQRERMGREAAGRFLTAVAGNYPDYEEVTRALWQGDRERMAARMATWPEAVREYAARLAGCEI
jgi:hypothetical protein